MLILDYNLANTSWELLNPAGPTAISNVVQTVKTDITSSNSTTYVDIAGMTVDITPAKSTSRVKVTVVLAMGNTTLNVMTAAQVLRDAVVLDIGDAAGSRTRAAVSTGTASSSNIGTVTYIFIDSPASTSALTYKVQWLTENAAFLAVLNRTSGDGDTATIARVVSSITVEEIL